MPSSWGARSGSRYGAEYDRFRTGLSFKTVKQMLWVASKDSREWRYRRRRTVLGFWHSLKLALWLERERREDVEIPIRRRREGGGVGDLHRNTPLRSKTPLRRKARIRSRRSTPRRSGRVRDRNYLLAVKELPCCLAGLGNCSGPIEADHAGRRPLGRKCSDDEAIPLCQKHHRERTDGYGFFLNASATTPDGPVPMSGWQREWCDRRIAETQARLGRRAA